MLRTLKSLVYPDVEYIYDTEKNCLVISGNICIPFTADNRFTDDALTAILDEYYSGIYSSVLCLQNTIDTLVKLGDETTFSFINWEEINILREKAKEQDFA